jgi:hypothetical protein
VVTPSGIIGRTAASVTRCVLDAVRWVVVGAIVALVAGSGSASVLVALDLATAIREAHPWLVWAMPLAGA